LQLITKFSLSDYVLLGINEQAGGFVWCVPSD